MKTTGLGRMLAPLCQELAGFGFVEHSGKGMSMVRQRGPFLDMLNVWVVKAGSYLDVVANIWTPFVEDELATFETEVDLHYIGITAGGHVSLQRVGEFGYWPVTDAAEAKGTVSDLEMTIRNVVMPWFDSVVDGESYITVCAQNRGWWRKVGLERRDRIRRSVDEALGGGVGVPRLRFVR